MKKYILKQIYKVLAFFTRFYIKKTNAYVIGITGSVGKTSCRMIIFQVLQKYIDNKTIYTSPKNFNSELGTIFSIFQIEEFNPGIISLLKKSFFIILQSLFRSKKYDIILLEYGVDHPGDMDFLLSIIKPNISIFTKLDSIHIENFNSKDDILKEKFKLIQNAKDYIYLNSKDSFLEKRHIEKILGDNDFKKLHNINYFNKDYSREYIKKEKDIYGKIVFDDNIITTNLLGDENYGYIILAYYILNTLGYKINKLNDYIELQNQSGRFNILKGINNSILIDSTYNAGPSSMKKMVENTILIKQKLYNDYELIFVLGDMRELGTLSEEEHKKLDKYISGKGIVFSVGLETKKYLKNSIKNFIYSRDLGNFLKEYILKNKDKKYLILFKASQNTIFLEEAIKKILLDNNDINVLVRQDKSWLKIKSKYL